MYKLLKFGSTRVLIVWKMHFCIHAFSNSIFLMFMFVYIIMNCLVLLWLYNFIISETKFDFRYSKLYIYIVFVLILGFLSHLYLKLYNVIRIVYLWCFVFCINYIDLFSCKVVIQFQNLHYLGNMIDFIYEPFYVSKYIFVIFLSLFWDFFYNVKL